MEFFKIPCQYHVPALFWISSVEVCKRCRQFDSVILEKYDQTWDLQILIDFSWQQGQSDAL